MKVDIELVLNADTKQLHTIEVRDKKLTPAILDHIDDAVNKKFADVEWKRWNLIEIHDEV